MKDKVVDKKVKYWYKTYMYECPVCGMQDIIKQRVYTEKPVEFEYRFQLIQRYDYCMEV